MITEPVPPAVACSPGHVRYAIIRCLHGARPEHRARRVVVNVLAATGLEGELADVETAVNEMATNALRHAPGPYELRIVLGCQSVKVAVVDGGADHDELARKLLRAAAPELTDGESGRGLQIVTRLFPGSWGVGPTTTCTGLTPAKQVWIMIGWPSWSEDGCLRRFSIHPVTRLLAGWDR
jgi:hypothetical protein